MKTPIFSIYYMHTHMFAFMYMWIYEKTIQQKSKEILKLVIYKKYYEIFVNMQKIFVNSCKNSRKINL